jgi:dCTP deaminase
MEKFNFPAWLCGSVLDKSSWARVGISAFNTHFDPGFCGYATLELVNLGPDPVEYLEGDPVCQFMFHLLDEPTEMPYAGKYNQQPKEPVPARYEEEI